MIYNNLIFTYSQIAGSTDNLKYQDYYNINIAFTWLRTQPFHYALVSY